MKCICGLSVTEGANAEYNQAPLLEFTRASRDLTNRDQGWPFQLFGFTFRE